MRIRSDFDVLIAYQICLSAHEAKISRGIQEERFQESSLKPES